MAKKQLFSFFNADKKDNQIQEIDIHEIVPSRYQPRLHFDDEALKELASSIEENGLIQPITVRKIDDHYEIIAGERRYRAFKLLGYETLQCFVLSPNEEQAAQMALVENVQREDLTAVEEAKSYVMLMRQGHLTQEEVANKVGKSQSSVANKIRLLNLPEEVQSGVIDGKITERHARALLTLPHEKQKEVYEEITNKGFNVRETEAYIESIQKPKRHRRQKTRGFTRQKQIAINTVEESVRLIRKLGIKAKMEVFDQNEEVQLIIHLPKES